MTRDHEHDPDDGPLEAVRFLGLRPGPRLLVLGAVHGNEVCGPLAIREAIEACRSGALRIRRGEVTFVPVANPKAYRQQTREGDRNLNRDLREKPVPQDFEDRVGNRLCRLLREHDALLDIHSFRGGGEPFVFFGPPDNDGDLEPFGSAEAEVALAACLGVPLAVHGWLANFERLLAARDRHGLPPPSITQGFGTTEYMRFAGGYGVTLECGSHDDSASVEVARQAIRNVLAHLRLTNAEAPRPALRAVIELTDIVLCEAEGDGCAPGLRTGDPVAAGALLGHWADGREITAPSDGFVVFPNAAPSRGEAILHFAVTSARAP